MLSLFVYIKPFSNSMSTTLVVHGSTVVFIKCVHTRDCASRSSLLFVLKALFLVTHLDRAVSKTLI